MPQLDPAPWFTILVLSWTIFLIILPPKVLSHTYPNDPAPTSVHKSKTNPWEWTWH